MKNTSKIQHLYLYIPDLKAQDFQIAHHVWTKIEQELTHITNQYGWDLKTIYIANSGNIIPYFFLEKILLLLATVAKNINQYSFEVNNNINNNVLKLLQKSGIDRLVWKIITFNNQKLNNSDQLFNTINNSIKMGFNNFSIDLNYNIDNQSKKQLLYDLQQCINLQAPHISFDNETEILNLQFKKIIKYFLTLHNYFNYEYYSYAKNSNYYSQYTIGYCLLENYYGIGPNAISYINTNKTTKLITNSDDIIYDKEITTFDGEQCFINKLLQGLLLKNGFKITEDFKKYMKTNKHLLKKLVDNGQIIINNEQLLCTNMGWGLLNDLIINIIDSNTV